MLGIAFECRTASGTRLPYIKSDTGTRPMKNTTLSRRDLLAGTAAVVAGTAFSTRVLSAAPPPEPVTPALIEAAKKEGQVIHYTSTDLPVAEKLAKAFEAKYP